MLPNDRLVCTFVQTYKVGDHFAEWPLHITIVPWFRLAVTTEVIARGLRKALISMLPFEARVKAEDWFGPQKNRKAHILGKNEELEEIETKVRNYFHKKRAWLVDETTHKPRQFRPHVTVQRSSTLKIGDSFLVDRLYIVEQKGDYKLVAAVIAL